MILHQQIHHDQGAPMQWWVFHVSTARLAWCTLNQNQLSVEVLFGKDLSLSVGTSHAIAAGIMSFIFADVRGIVGNSLFNAALKTTDKPPAILPEYLLLNTLDGLNPAIARTVDPVFHCFADPETATLREIQPADPGAALPVAGWEYWWTDAQQHFDELTEAFLADSEE